MIIFRIMEYSNLQDVSVFCGTWNVNARTECATSDLSSWILPSETPLADIYAIGLQEMVDLNAVNVMVSNHVSDEASLLWCQQLLSTLNARAGAVVENSYELLTERHMVGIQFFIFIKSSLSASIRDVRFSVTPTGVMGMLGNKGGIAVRMNIYDSSVCFVCAHLHAGRDNTYERNLDFQTIIDTTVFPSGRNSIERPADSTFTSAPVYKPSTTIDQNRSADLQIFTHEHVFWFGDLNYRIDEKLSKDEIFDTLATGEWESLKINDQLCLERAKGNSFQGFQEGALCFPPTYKYQPGTDNYIDRDAKKPRAPAWCDRILWRSAPISSRAVQLKSYRCATKLNASDHKPVSAHFQCSFHDINLENMRSVYSNILFQVDKWVNASTPKLAVDGRIIDFGTISFTVCCSASQPISLNFLLALISHSTLD
jgi:phosphatidylinositol-bisphosphatase